MRAKKGNQRGRQTGRESATKVLYVQHDEDNLYMLKMRLERYGDFEVLTAEDSEQGCKLAVTGIEHRLATEFFAWHLRLVNAGTIDATQPARSRP